MKDEQQLEDISKKLTLIAALLLKQISDEQSNADLVHFLNTFKLSNAEIADLLGMKTNAVAMAQSRLSKGKS